VEIELEHYVGAVGFGSVYADSEEIGDVFVAFAFGEQLKDFALAGGEAIARGFRGIGAVDVGQFGGGGHTEGEVGFVLAKGIDGCEQDAVGIILEDIATSTGFDDLLNEVVGFVHGKNQNFGMGGDFSYAARGFYTVQEGHADIEYGDIRLMFSGLIDGVATVGSFGADLPGIPRFEKRAEAGADNRVVIRDQDAKGWCH
jgi:hypothetical protein